MSTLINGEEVEPGYEIWSVKQTSTDGKVEEIVFPEGEEAARLDAAFYGGELWVRTCYVTKGKRVIDEPVEEPAFP